MKSTRSVLLVVIIACSLIVGCGGGGGGGQTVIGAGCTSNFNGTFTCTQYSPCPSGASCPPPKYCDGASSCVVSCTVLNACG